MSNDQDGLFQILERALQQSKVPMGSRDLYEMPYVQAAAASANRVSDYLGALWRKGKVLRVSATDTGKYRARWLYIWKKTEGASPGAHEYKTRLLADRPGVQITEKGKVITIDLPNLVISIRQKTVRGDQYLASLKRTNS